MKAVILCAGLGTRLGNLVNDVPKPMLPISGKPMLYYIIENLKKYDITEIAINLHYLPDFIPGYFDDGSKFGVNITYSYEEKLLGTAGALIKLKDWLCEEDFFVIYGDIITNQDLSEIINKHKEENAFAALLLHKRKKSNSLVRIDDQTGRITLFKERPDESEYKKHVTDENEEVWVNSGVQLLSCQALNFIVKNNAFDLPKDVYSKVYNKEKLYGIPLTGNRVAVDSPERYELAKKIF